jgi:HK97 family phage major capsid protein
MEIKEITDAIDLASKGLKEGVEGAKTQASEALAEAKKALEAMEAKASKEDITGIKSDLEAKVKELQDQHDALSTKVNKSVDKTPAYNKSFRQALEEALTEKKEEIDGILARGGKQSGPLMLDVKAPVMQLKEAVTMGDYNTIEAVGSASHYTLTSDTGIISTIRKRILNYLRGVSVGGLSVDKPYAMWIEELDEQGNPIFIGEGDPKTQLSVRYEEREAKAKKIGVYGKVTTEMLRYLPQLINYIQNNLIKRMDIKTEDQLIDGDGLGDNLKGILDYATAFDGGAGVAGVGLAGTVTDANIYDVLRAVALQVQNSYGMAERIFVTPDTIANMDIEKDTEGRYLIPPFKTSNGTQVAGMELIPTLGLIGTGFDFVGGDLSVVHVEFLYQTNIQIGLDGNDFTNNKKTILVEQELVQFVSANDTQVLIKGDFASAIAILEATT